VLQELRGASLRSADRRRRERKIYKDKDVVVGSGCWFEALHKWLVIGFEG